MCNADIPGIVAAFILWIKVISIGTGIIFAGIEDFPHFTGYTMNLNAT
jgi:hypothetical protein